MKKTGSPKLLFENVDLSPIRPILWWGLHEDGPGRPVMYDPMHACMQHSHVIYSSLHVHLSERECLGAVAVKGDADEIRKLAQELATKKGVKQVRSTIVSP